MQSTGQAWVLQVWVWAVVPQAIPPWAAAVVVVRVRVWEPVPQLAVQADQVDQLVCTQSTGHASSLQLRASSRLGHTSPEWRAPVVTVRVRFWAPEPHDLEQADQVDQEETTQWTGQAPSLQA